MIVFRFLVTVFLAVVVAIETTVLGLNCIIQRLLGVPDKPGSAYDWTPRVWSKILLAACGVRVIVHNRERAGSGQAQIYVANHMSWFDIPVLSSQLPRYKFVAKAELFKVPVFGPSIRAIGMIPIARQNLRAAFAAYEEAAAKIREGNSVVVFPEGTRGTDYPVRPFKKGPFVLAIAAGVPLVPVLVYGTREVLPRGSLLVRPGKVHVHLLEPIPTAGLSYDQRETLGEEVRTRIAEELFRQYGVGSPGVSLPEPQPANGSAAIPSITE